MGGRRCYGKKMKTEKKKVYLKVEFVANFLKVKKKMTARLQKKKRNVILLYKQKK